MLDALQRSIPFVAAVPKRLLLTLVRLYQRGVSPVLPAIFGPTFGCRFHPTCSVYAATAVEQHGVVRGGWLALYRLLRCTPLSPGGFDDVPPAERRPRPGPARPVCRRVAA